jgi:hypothetical protein
MRSSICFYIRVKEHLLLKQVSPHVFSSGLLAHVYMFAKKELRDCEQAAPNIWYGLWLTQYTS